MLGEARAAVLDISSVAAMNIFFILDSLVELNVGEDVPFEEAEGRDDCPRC